MTVQSILALCRHCRGELTLLEVVEERTGLCPRCRWLLAPEWVPLLLDHANRAERAQLALVGSLRRLVGLPGNLEVVPTSVFRNLCEEVDWSLVFVDDSALRSSAVDYLQSTSTAWEHVAPAQRSPDMSHLRRALRRNTTR